MFTLTKSSVRFKFKLIHYYESISIVRRFNFLNNEQYSSHEQNYMRTVLQRTNGCVLFESRLKWNKQLIQKESNPIVQRLISIVDKLRKNNPTNYELINHGTLMAISKQCVEKYHDWPIDTQLHALDTWHYINGGKNMPYFKKQLTDFVSRFPDLNAGPALQVMYYVAWSKRPFRSQDESAAVIKQFEKHINRFELDEVSIYCLALIKSDVHVENENLIESLYDCLLQNDLQQFDHIGVTAIVKAVRRFSTTIHIHKLEKLQRYLIPFAKEASLMSLTHIIQLGAKQRAFNRQLIQVVLQRFLSKFNALRIKDAERALLALSVLNDKKNAIEAEFLQKSQEYLLQSLSSNFVESVFRCISYLMVCGVADVRLINWALDPEIRSIAFRNKTDGIEFPLLLIDSYAKINLGKTYTGHRLPVELCANLMPKIAEQEKTGRQSELTTEIGDTLQKNGIDCIQCHVAPCIPFADTFFIYNKRTNKTVCCHDRYNHLPGTILKASDLHRNDRDLECVAIVSCLQRQTVFKSNRYSGIFQLKLDQLKSLGFKVIVIKRAAWILYTSVAAKRRYLTTELCKNNIFLLNRSKVDISPR